MYKISKENYGFKLEFSDFINADEMKRWVEESKSSLVGAASEFGVLVDMRNLKPLLPDVQEVMQQGQKLYKEKGMVRSAVILSTTIITLQFKRIAMESGIDAWERYIDSSKVANWEEVAIKWVKDGIDPDKK